MNIRTEEITLGGQTDGYIIARLGPRTTATEIVIVARPYPAVTEEDRKAFARLTSERGGGNWTLAEVLAEATRRTAEGGLVDWGKEPIP